VVQGSIIEVDQTLSYVFMKSMNSVFKSGLTPCLGVQGSSSLIQSSHSAGTEHNECAAITASDRELDTSIILQDVAKLSVDMSAMTEAMEASQACCSALSQELQSYRAEASDLRMADTQRLGMLETNTRSQISLISNRISDVEVLIGKLQQENGHGKAVQKTIPLAIDATMVEALQHEIRMLQESHERYAQHSSLLELQADVEKMLRISDEGASAMLNQQIDISEVGKQVSELNDATASLQRTMQEYQARREHAEMSASHFNEIQIQIAAVVEDHAKTLQQAIVTQQARAAQLDGLSTKVSALEAKVTPYVTAASENGDKHKPQATAFDAGISLREATFADAATACSEQAQQQILQLDAKLQMLNSNCLSLTAQHDKIAADLLEVRSHVQKLDVPSSMRAFGELIKAGKDSSAIFFVDAMKGSIDNAGKQLLDSDRAEIKQWVMHKTEILTHCLDAQVKMDKRVGEAEAKLSAIPQMSQQIQELEKRGLQPWSAVRNPGVSPAISPIRRISCKEVQKEVERRPVSPIGRDHNHDTRSPYFSDHNSTSSAVDIAQIRAPATPSIPLSLARSASLEGPPGTTQNPRSLSPSMSQRALQSSTLGSSAEAKNCLRSPAIESRTLRQTQPVPQRKFMGSTVQRPVVQTPAMVQTSPNTVRFNRSIPDCRSAVAKAVPSAFP